MEFHGLDGYGGPLYIGTGCFHRRDTLCGRKFTRGSTNEFEIENSVEREETIHELEENSKVFASCTYEKNSEWGKEVSLFLSTSTFHISTLHIYTYLNFLDD